MVTSKTEECAMTETTRFPADWTEWRAEWKEWLARQERSQTFTLSTWRFPDKNFLADEVLGVWRVNDRTVELSEVTFPDLSQPPYRAETRRYVGITYGQASGIEDGGLASSFEELERALGIDS
jgi:hypothetical protein